MLVRVEDDRDVAGSDAFERVAGSRGDEARDTRVLRPLSKYVSTVQSRSPYHHSMIHRTYSRTCIQQNCTVRTNLTHTAHARARVHSSSGQSLPKWHSGQSSHLQSWCWGPWHPMAKCAHRFNSRIRNYRQDLHLASQGPSFRVPSHMTKEPRSGWRPIRMPSGVS